MDTMSKMKKSVFEENLSQVKQIPSSVEIVKAAFERKIPMAVVSGSRNVSLGVHTGPLWMVKA